MGDELLPFILGNVLSEKISITITIFYFCSGKLHTCLVVGKEGRRGDTGWTKGGRLSVPTQRFYGQQEGDGIFSLWDAPFPIMEEEEGVGRWEGEKSFPTKGRGTKWEEEEAEDGVSRANVMAFRARTRRRRKKTVKFPWHESLLFPILENILCAVKCIRYFVRMSLSAAVETRGKSRCGPPCKQVLFSSSLLTFL